MARPTGRPAGRPKKQPTFEPPGFKQAVRARLIEYARRHGSAALHLLATDVWRGEMTLDAWAKSFNVAGTWVEAWTQDVRDAWREGIRYPAPAVSESGVLTMWYPSPDDGHTAADVFSCHLTGTPLAQLQHGIIFGGDASACWNPGENDETAFRRRMHARLDDALDDFFRHAPEFGASSRITIPKGLDLKIECAALYLLCSVSRADLVKRLKSTHVAKEAMYNWLQDAMQVLDLRTKLPLCRVVYVKQPFLCIAHHTCRNEQMQHIPERSTELLTETKVADILTVSVWTLRAWWRENVYHGKAHFGVGAGIPLDWFWRARMVAAVERGGSRTGGRSAQGDGSVGTIASKMG